MVFSKYSLQAALKSEIGIILSQSRRLPPLQVVSNSKFVSVGVQSPTEINAPRGCAVILIGICQLRWPESRAKSHGRSTWIYLYLFRRYYIVTVQPWHLLVSIFMKTRNTAGSPYADLDEKVLMQASLQHTFSFKPAHGWTVTTKSVFCLYGCFPI